jgi:hypothetical protein
VAYLLEKRRAGVVDLPPLTATEAQGQPLRRRVLYLIPADGDDAEAASLGRALAWDGRSPLLLAAEVALDA